jgi:hypothetical protein
MLVAMNRRLLRALVPVLVLAQVLLSAPVVAAIAAHDTAPASTQMPCADSMPQADEGKPCPCCPDTAGLAACLSTCTASVGFIANIPVSVGGTSDAPLAAMPLVHLAELADPPLKPPPIALQFE